MSKQEALVDHSSNITEVSPDSGEMSLRDRVQGLLNTLEVIDMFDSLTDAPLYQTALDNAREDIQNQAHRLIAQFLPNYMPKPGEKLSTPNELPPDAGLDYINRLIAGGHFLEIDPDKITFLKSMHGADVIRFRIQAIDVQIAHWMDINENSDKSPGFEDEEKNLLNLASERMLKWLNSQKDLEAKRLDNITAEQTS